MSTIIKAKRSSVQGKVPVTTDLELGEFAINTYDGKLFTKKNVNGTESIVDLSLGTTNLGYSANSTAVTVTSDTGSDINILAANGTTAGVLTAEAQTIGGAKTFSGNITANQVSSTNNGAGTNFQVGDDAWIGDINLDNTIRITGQQDGTKGYIVFGNSSNTALGRTGTGSLTYGGSAIILASDTASAATASKVVIRDGSSNFSANTITAALSGNATTATTLQTARTIGGVSFDGSANINLPGVNATGNQNTTGSAATLTTARNINGVSFNGSANITVPSLYDTNYRRITNPGGAEYVTTTATVTGAIEVVLPVGMTNTMMRMTIKIYEYATNESFEVIVGGYTHPSGNTWTNNPFAYIIGNPGIDRRFTVRFGYNAAGRAVVYIGELASTWSFPQVFVTDVQLGYGGQSATWVTGWAINFRATAFENVTATITNPQIGYAVSTNTANATVLRDGSGNFSAGTITAALSGNATTATTLQTARTIAISGDVTGTATSFNGSANITISAGITADSIVNADINSAAAIADTKLATISTAGKVSNSATTATDANTANAIVARNASGNFTAGTITAALTGAASSNVLKAGDTMTGKLNLAGNDSFRLIESLNTSASSAVQFYVEHNLGNTNVGNARGVLNLVSNGALTIGGSVALTASNFNTYAPTLTGTGASGSWNINAATVTNGALTTGTLAQFAATTSSQLAGVISDETGSGALVFGTSPTFTTTIDGGATFGAFASSTALTLGYTGTAASTINISTGATATATTKTVNLGTGGAAGSTTNINIGSSVAGTTTISSPNITISGLADTATTATHYYVETASGNILPKTLANARTELVTTSAVNSAAATTVGTITSGTWTGSVIGGQYGGTGVNNTGRTITLGGNVSTANTFTTSGNFALTLTSTAATSVTLPTSGTLATTGNLAQFAATTSAQLAGVISDETGSGALVFGTSPTFTTSIVAASTTMALFDTTATTVNFAGAATTGNFGYDGTAASITNLSVGATISGATKTINIGTGGASGSTTNIKIGSSTLGSLGTTYIDTPIVLLSTSTPLPAARPKVGVGAYAPATIVGGTDTSAVLSIGGTDLTLAVGDSAGSLSFITESASYFATYADAVTGEIASISESSTGAAFGLAFYTGTTTGSNRGERVRISANGNVGIGTTSPASRLDVNGTARATSIVINGGTLTANGSVGTSTQVLSSNGTGVYWASSIARASVSDTSPSTPGEGQLWFDSSDNTINVFYNDGTSSQWVSAVSNQVDAAFRIKTSNYTAVNRDNIIADTSAGSFTITLPASPTTGQYVTIYDNASWGINNLTIGRNGSTIESLADDFVIDVSSIKVEFIYNSSTWQIYSSVAQTGPGTAVPSLDEVAAIAIALG